MFFLFLFLIVYHIPGKSMHLTCEFTADTCGTNAVASFEKHVLETLEKLTDHLQCEIQQWGSQCHAATDTLGKLTHKLAFQFVGKREASHTHTTLLCEQIVQTVQTSKAQAHFSISY